MRNVTRETVTDAVVASLGKHGEITERQREIMTALVRHLHDFCRDVTLTHGEFIEACQFLARAGAACDDKRQEFILLGDILGVEVLADMLGSVGVILAALVVMLTGWTIADPIIGAAIGL